MLLFMNVRRNEQYLFFFNLDGNRNQKEKTISFLGKEIKVTLSPKACGAVHVKGDRILSSVVKGTNEIENIEGDISIVYGKDSIKRKGDFITLA